MIVTIHGRRARVVLRINATACVIRHIPGKHNVLADHLSRNGWDQEIALIVHYPPTNATRRWLKNMQPAIKLQVPCTPPAPSLMMSGDIEPNPGPRYTLKKAARKIVLPFLGGRPLYNIMIFLMTLKTLMLTTTMVTTLTTTNDNNDNKDNDIITEKDMVSPYFKAGDYWRQETTGDSSLGETTVANIKKKIEEILLFYINPVNHLPTAPKLWVQMILGILTFYRQFIHEFTTKTEFLTRKLKKDAPTTLTEEDVIQIHRLIEDLTSSGMYSNY